MNRTCTLRTIGLAAALLSLSVVTNAATGDGAPDATYKVPTYHSQTSEVEITFSATDQNRHAIANLSATDFAVVDKDFIVRNFRSFTRTEYTRLDVAVLLDTSESMTPGFRAEITEFLNLLSETSGVPQENISVISFHNSAPAMLCQGNCRGQHAAELIAAASTGGQTPLYDTLEFTADSLAQMPKSENGNRTRRVAIVFTDGADTISRHTSADAIQALIENEVVVYTVNVGSANSSGAACLKKLADSTAGQSFGLQDGAGAVADAVLNDFHASYELTYRLPYATEGFHALQILPTHNLKLNFRCRQGYDYPAAR